MCKDFEWRKQKREQRARFTTIQSLPYEVKVRRQARRAWEFYEEMQARDMNCHVSVGGIDSITLYIWLKSIGINVPAISVSNVEDKSIQREEALIEHGCNYYGKTTVRSAPLAPFTRDDILRLSLEMDQWYLGHKEVFEELYHKQTYSRDAVGNTIPYKPVESIIPAIYGEIKRGMDGGLKTTGAQRTGCSMCGFGIHLEKRPHRFDRKRQENPKEWEYLMYHLVKDKETGEEYGWGRVLDYIGVGWEDIPPVQMSMFELMEGIE